MIIFESDYVHNLMGEMPENCLRVRSGERNFVSCESNFESHNLYLNLKNTFVSRPNQVENKFTTRKTTLVWSRPLPDYSEVKRINVFFLTLKLYK